ncbi:MULTISPECIES: hypothetical protein [unclassified Methylobacterium]|uniref:hypothetical protein n=1 Tax=unclassified Methylobacterium TaxID=2615210 RepID=UPI00226A1ACA|nr:MULTISPECIES: hypothetical protein [unclassified Methylobacterium]
MSDLPPAVASWRDQIERLSEHASPCRYLAPVKWAAIRANALTFIDRFGAEAHRLGWTAPELFGVHPQNGTLRVDSCGALMLSTGAAQAVHADRVSFAQTSGYRFLKGQTPGIPVWEFASISR